MSSITITTKNQYPTVQAALPSAQTFVTMAHITSPKLTSITDRKKPLRLCAALDVSLSMRGEKLDLAKRSLSFMVDELGPNDEFGLVTFSDNASTILMMTKMNAAGRKAAKRAIDRMRVLGATNLASGLSQAVSQVLPPQRVTHRASFMPYLGGGPKTHIVIPPPAPAPAPAPVKQVPVILPTFYVTVKSQHALVPKDGKKFHAHWFQVATTPSTILEKYIDSVTWEANGCSAKTGADVAMDLQPEGQPVAGVAISLKLKTGHVTKILHISATATQDESTPSVYKVEAACASPFTGPIPENIPTPPELPTAEDTVVPPPAPPTTTTVTAKVSSDDYCRAVMIFTDGQVNRGIRDATGMLSTCETIRAHCGRPDADYTVHTFGFGSDHNASLLREISETTQGSYYYIANTNTMREVFADCLGGLISIVAQGVKIIVTPAAGISINKIMTHFPVTMSPVHSGAHVITMKDLYSEENRDLPVEISVCPGFVASPSVPLLSWTVEYDNCMTGEREAKKCDSRVDVVPEACTAPANADVDAELNRYQTAETLEAVKREASANNFAKAKELLASQKSRMRANAAADLPQTHALFGDMDDCDDLLDASRWEAEGSKQVSNLFMNHAQQRCCRASPSAAYQNKFKMDMKRKAANV